ncbi:Maf family protein [Otariodibacter sp.]|uniref:Maf family protein n=1 Tax=Otariodibacter sp. TaxID=3030919 RepID=UPI002605ECCF|nr:Maf family protein [Otariodibacter sp.]
MKSIYLASNSPRRWELLQQLGLDLHSLQSEIDETPHPNEEAKSYCLRVAIEKNKAAQAVRSAKNLANFPILTADTTVSIDQMILGKPKDKDEAYSMLKRLSGKTHQVFTAVCISDGEKQYSCVQTSEVTFKVLSDLEINAYIATGQPMDKAGAYGIQGIGGCFISHLTGSFTGVMGLPMYETADLLKQCGIEVLD